MRHAVGLNNANAIDQVLEGIVYMELKRRGYDVHVGKVGDKEIDFIARRGDTVSYYQVTYLLGSQQTVDREFGVFEAVRDNWPKYVLSMDDFPQMRNGIRGMNIIDWLLAKD
ncbi:ATP-binding protein [Bifidobacterium colobi]|uniref:ATP-binding protein n=1 Tax=Bifidobacterium colobi TaxID=2809026 RepID=UPI001BDBF59B|nr:ATP-binding protein [Bifidobacterium colobi]